MIKEETFKVIVNQYTSNLFRFVFKNIKDEKASEDIVQNAFIKLWENRKTVDPLKIKSWLFSTANHLLINYVKRASKMTPIEGLNFEEPYQLPDDNFNLKEILNSSLDELPLIQKNIILLRDLEGYSYEEIGDILHLNPSQVKVYLFRGRQTIKNRLKNINQLI